MKKLDIWEKKPHAENFQRAARYLALRLPAEQVRDLLTELHDAEVEWQLGDDVLRAARLKPLTIEDPAMRRHVRGLLEHNHKMHPILVVRFGMRSDIADGYHAASIASWLGPQVGCPVLTAGP